MIVAAAVKIFHAVISMEAPARHNDILRQINGLYWDFKRQPHTFGAEVQGFITDKGVFLDRRQAFEHVHACGQGTPRRRTSPGNYQGDELFSEDLW